MGRRASKPACQTCRERHLRCDSSRLPCANCVRSCRECKPASRFLFRPVSKYIGSRHRHRRSANSSSPALEQENGSPHGQEDKIAVSSSIVRFIDETPEFASRPSHVDDDHTSPVASITAQTRSRSPQPGSPQVPQGQLSGCFSLNTSPISHSHETEYQAPLPTDGCTAEDIFSTRNPPSHIDNEGDYTRQKCHSGFVGRLGTDSRHEKISQSEAHLLRYFIQVWGPLLDATDESRQFSTSIPYLAWTESTCLRYAILALTACQLSRVSNHPVHAARYYREKCAQVLVPILLADPNKVHEASIFATYVLLRVYDHLTVNLSERQPESLFSDGLALSTEPWNTYSNNGSLKRAAFWIHLRQDIHIALILECPVRVDHSLYEQTIAAAMEITENDIMERDAAQSGQIGDHWSPPSGSTTMRCNTKVECAWTNRLVGLVCRILNYCFDARPQSVKEWSSLTAELESWNIEKPETFSPFFEVGPNPGEDRPFPEIHLQNDWHVLGLMYYHMSVVLLKSNQPKRPCQNMDLRALEYNTREELLHHARMLCGIAVSNPIHQALLIVTAMLNVVACFFSDLESQNGVLELLELAGKTTGSPTDTIVRKLCRVWEN